MNDKIKELLKKLGVSESRIQDLSDVEKSKDFNVAEAVEETMEAIKGQLKNDEAFVSELEKKHRAAILSSKENKLKKAFEYLGISDDEFSALPENRKFDAMIELLGAKAKESKASGDSKEEIAKLNKMVSDLQNEKKKYEEEIIPGIKGQVELERQAIHLDSRVRKALSAHQLILEADHAMPVINSIISSKYDLKVVDGEVKVFQKGKELEAYDDNRRPVTLDGLISTTVEEAKLKKVSNAKPPRTENSEPPKYQPKGLSKAEAHLEQLKKK